MGRTDGKFAKSVENVRNGEHPFGANQAYFEKKDDNSITTENVRALASALEARPAAFEPVRLFHMRGCGLDDGAGAALVATLTISPQLLELDFASNRLGDGFLAALGGTVRLGGMPMLETLGLYSNEFGDAGIATLFAALNPPDEPEAVVGTEAPAAGEPAADEPEAVVGTEAPAAGEPAADEPEAVAEYPEEWQPRLDRLQGRFPAARRTAIIKAMVVNDGHAGKSANDLIKAFADGMTASRQQGPPGKKWALNKLTALTLFDNDGVSVEGGGAAIAAAISAGALPSLTAPQFGGMGRGLSAPGKCNGIVGAAFRHRQGGCGTLIDAANEHEAVTTRAKREAQGASRQITLDAAGGLGVGVVSWGGDLVVNQLEAGGAAAVAGIGRYDVLLRVAGEALPATAEAAVRLNSGGLGPAGSELAVTAHRPPEVDAYMSANGKPTLRGAHKVVELMERGRTIDLSGAMWGRTVVRLRADGMIESESESCHGGPRIGESGSDKEVTELEAWLPKLLTVGMIDKVKGWL